MNLKRFALGAVVLLAVTASACVSMSVSSHFERGADFSRLRTWDWGQPDGLPTGDPRLDNNAFFTDHLQGAVEKSLATRGFARVPAGTTPDVLVHYHANISQRFEVNEPDVNCSPGDCRASVIDYEQGTLVLDMIDARTNKLLWRGWARDSVEGVIDNQDRMERQITEAVTKMFARFPTE
jgi:hypothetical protein